MLKYWASVILIFLSGLGSIFIYNGVTSLIDSHFNLSAGWEIFLGIAMLAILFMLFKFRVR